MFALVKFTNGETEIVKSKRVKIIEGDYCVVKYPGGGNYSANLIDTSDLATDFKKLKNVPRSNEERCSTGLIETDLATDFKKSQNVPYGTEKRCSKGLIMTDLKTDLNKTKNVDRSTNSTANLIETDCLNNLNKTFNISSNTHPIENKNSSTPIHSDVDAQQLVSSIAQDCSSILYSHNTTAESSLPPSGFTDEINELGPNWPDECIEKNTENGKDTVSSINDNDSSRNDSISNFKNDRAEGITSNDHDNSEDVANNDDDTGNCEDITNNDPGDKTYNPGETSTVNTDISTKLNSPVKAKSFDVNKNCSIDVREVIVPSSSNKKSKRHFCPYCHTLQAKFSRHLQLKHKNESEVKKFIYLPPKNKNRTKIIETIRKKGNFLHNTNPDYNTGILIVSRQQRKGYSKDADSWLPCDHCGAFYTRSTLRFHYAKCNKSHHKGAKNILSASRRLTGYIHMAACDKSRRDVFPVLREDDVVNCIRYDELIIHFGNKLCDKYTLAHQHDLIRSQLRYLGKIKLEMISFNADFYDFKNIFKPQHYDNVIRSLRKIAKWNDDIMWFEKPCVAQNLSALLKKCAGKLRTECIKAQDNESKKLVVDFLLLWEEEVPTLINKKALDNLIDQRRLKKYILPSKRDIKKLYEYLSKECRICLNLLEDEFNPAAWQLLNQCTLILIQIFNRRRSGEIERLTIQNYENKEILDEDTDRELYTKFSKSQKAVAKEFTRLILRGKLNRTVSVLLSPFNVACIKKILLYRKEAGVATDNEFLFAVSYTNHLAKKYFRACPLMRQFANECGAFFSNTLRGTTLRKHMATYTVRLNVEEYKINRLADFMGHHKDIHKTIYRIPVSVAEITDVSRLLLSAIGIDKNKVNDDSMYEIDEDEEEAEASDGGTSNEENENSSSDEEHNFKPDMTNRKNGTQRNNNSRLSQAPSSGSGNTSAYASTSQDNSAHLSDHLDDADNMVATSSKRKRHHKSNSSCLPKKKQRVCTAAEKKKIRWSYDEKRAIFKSFGKLDRLAHLPSLMKCREAIKKHRALKFRTPQQVKTWIHNQIRHKKLST